MKAPLTDFKSFDAVDRALMRAALGLARRGLGRTAPNPAVGCILYRKDIGSGRIVGRGWTQPGGRPHAETQALAQAGDAARGAHAFVTLEPCNHRGETGPCSEALIAAGVAAVTAAIRDPDPRTAGSGLTRLAEAGITIREGLCVDGARALNAGFFAVLARTRPWVTMKTATTLDGAIAARSGDSKWITGEAARRRGHLLRAQNDAIVTGIGTQRADDPELTCRLDGLEDRSPVRVLIDARAEVSTHSVLLKTIGKAPVWVVVGEDTPEATRRRLENAGATVFSLATEPGGRIGPAKILEILAHRGVTRVLLEAGAGLSSAFMSAGLVDEIAWFRAPAVMGGDGLPAVAPMAVNAPMGAPKFRLTETIALEGDVLERYLRVETES